MAAYMQMGHDTENLIGIDDCEEYGGIILSPVNREPEKMAEYVNQFAGKACYDLVFDPQLYSPGNQRGHLGEYSYYPSDIDTADPTSGEWWNDVTAKLIDYLNTLPFNAVTSPVIFPKLWDDDYFAYCNEISTKLSEGLKGTKIRVLKTALVHTTYLNNIDSVMKTASILSNQPCAGYYLVFANDLKPRLEFSNQSELLGMMRFIRELKNTNLPILVSCCSSDMILFKAAGATDCGTGKFFNLRRFTKSRYDDDVDSGGLQLPYWFEHGLMAFLREADILRLKGRGLGGILETSYSKNSWSNQIIENLASKPPKPWIGLGWRQYLSWFGKAELAIKSGNIRLVDQWLSQAEKNWVQLGDVGILMDEVRNDGSWLRPWRLALSDFLKESAL